MFQGRRFHKAIFIMVVVFLLVCSVLLNSFSSPSSFGYEKVEKDEHVAGNEHFDIIFDVISSVNETKLFDYVSLIESFGPHPTGSEAIDELAMTLYGILASTSLEVAYHHWTSNRYSGKNIEAVLKASNPDADGVFIVCAHYDSLEISPGAEDDGSGVAAVLVLAEILDEYHFPATIKFVLFSGEEHGLFGSEVYAREAFNRQENIIGVLALDKIGYAETSEEGATIYHHANKPSEWMVNISTTIASLYHDIIGLDVIAMPQDDGSDHKSFVDVGYDGSDFVRYGISPYYHTSEDTIEHMNFTYLTKATKLAIGTLCHMALFSSSINEDDINIIIKGSFLSELSQFYVAILNNNEDNALTANVNITLIHPLRNIYVQSKKEFYNILCHWNFTKEITDIWEFHVSGRSYTYGFIGITVRVTGIDDDAHISIIKKTYGLIPSAYNIWIIPIL